MTANVPVGNQTLYQMLTAAVSSEHLCHACLFFGEEGIGKRTAARFLASAVLCESSKEKPCGQCASCMKFSHGNHPDFYEYAGKRGKNAIGVDEIRQIRQDAYTIPNDGTYKVYLIPYVEEMSASAANALLKVLEEPPAHAIFLLTANHYDHVMETIRSRCVKYPVLPLSDAQVISILKDRFPDASEEKCQKAAAIAGGNPGMAIAAMGETEEDVPLAQSASDALAFGDEYVLLCACTKASASSQTMRAMLVGLLRLLRASFLAKTNKTQDTLAGRITLRGLMECIAITEESIAALDGNINNGLLAMELTSRLMNARRFV